MRRIFFGILITLFSHLAFADTAWLTNSDVLKGQITSLKDGILQIKTNWGGDIKVKLKYVRALETEQLLWVRMKGQNAFKLLKFQHTDNQTFAVDNEGNEYAIDSSVELATLQEKQPDENKWVHSGTVSLLFNADSDDEDEFDISGTLKFRDLVNHHNIKWKLRKTWNSGEIDEDEHYIHYDYNRFINGQWYTTANSQYNYDVDESPQMDYRLGAGLGYQLWDTPVSQLKSDLSVEHVWEDYKNGDDNIDRFAMTSTTSYTRTLWKNIHSDNLLAISRRFGGDNEYLYNLTSGLKFDLTANLWFNTQLSYQYDTVVLASDSNTDYELSFGLGYSW